jgi:trehalose 6-phosphate synthase/phosphatase
LKCCYFLEGLKEFDARWIGWAGVNVPDEIGQEALTKALAEKVQKPFVAS